jgi:hypothetical protein
MKRDAVMRDVMKRDVMKRDVMKRDWKRIKTQALPTTQHSALSTQH